MKTIIHKNILLSEIVLVLSAMLTASCGKSESDTGETGLVDGRRDSSAAVPDGSDRGTGGRTGDAGGGHGGVGGFSDGTGGLSGVGGGAGGERPCPRDPLLEGDMHPIDPSLFDGGTFGCHAERILAPDGWLQGIASDTPDCVGNSDCLYKPKDLPCGACQEEGFVCSMGVWSPCDCGRGPFLDNFFDPWYCKCLDGNWDCRVVAPSGASCFVCSFADGGTP